jgi:hypothetical protein
MTFIGLFVYIILTNLGYFSYPNYYGIVFEIGKGWGAMSLGPIMIVNERPNDYALQHEFGHSL